jgi:hypothetical protein
MMVARETGRRGSEDKEHCDEEQRDGVSHSVQMYHNRTLPLPLDCLTRSEVQLACRHARETAVHYCVKRL